MAPRDSGGVGPPHGEGAGLSRPLTKPPTLLAKGSGTDNDTALQPIRWTSPEVHDVHGLLCQEIALPADVLTCRGAAHVFVTPDRCTVLVPPTPKDWEPGALRILAYRLAGRVPCDFAQLEEPFATAFAAEVDFVLTWAAA